MSVTPLSAAEGPRSEGVGDKVQDLLLNVEFTHKDSVNSNIDLSGRTTGQAFLPVPRRSLTRLGRGVDEDLRAAMNGSANCAFHNSS